MLTYCSFSIIIFIVKMRMSKHKKVKVIYNNKLVDFYISHEEIYEPALDLESDFEVEKQQFFAGWFSPVRKMSLKKKMKILYPISQVLFE